MWFQRDLHNLKALAGAAVAIGNFDGVHLGHQHLIAQLRQLADQHQVPAVVLLFEPQPNEFFSPEENCPGRLMRLQEKLSALAALGVDGVVCLRFNQQLAAWSAEQFVRELLVKWLAVKAIVVGQDFRFGYQRQGDVAFLQRQGLRYDFSVHSMADFTVANQRVSSSRVREALAAGDMSGARQLLGRWYSITGRVGHGEKRGRRLGFATANIFLQRRAVPLSGIFVVQVTGLGDQPLRAVASLGTRPVFQGTHWLLEVHIADFSSDIYRQRITVEFLHKIRDEQHFDSVPALVAQMAIDLQQSRDFQPCI